MENDQLIPAAPHQITHNTVSAASGVYPPLIKYARLDDNYYSFTYDMGGDEEGRATIHVRMDESDAHADKTSYVDAEFEQEIPESERSYLALAAACGTASGVFSLLRLKGKLLDQIGTWKEKDWQNILIKAANVAGYKKKDYRGALEYLLNRAITLGELAVPEDKRGFIKEKLSEMSTHPSLAGLVLSIFTQFSGQAASFDPKRGVTLKAVPKYYALGNTIGEKLIFGFLYWLFYLATDTLLSGRQFLEDLGLPRELIRIIKEFVNLPLLQFALMDYEEAEERFSNLLRDLFSRGAEAEDGDSVIHSILRMINEDTGIMEQAFPVLLNESLVRGTYVVCKLTAFAKEQKVSGFPDLDGMDLSELLPFNNRLISKMLLIANGTFVASNLAGAALKALAGKKAKNREFAEAFLTEINFVGIGRFVISCASDSRYWAADIKIIFEKVFHGKQRQAEAKVVDDPEEAEADAYELLTLDAIQARVLYSLESLLIQYDIEHTKKEHDKKAKQQWHAQWQAQILTGTDMREDYFVTDEDLIYQGIRELFADQSSQREFYLLTMELALFTPYYSLGCKNDKAFQRLKPEYDYVSQEFVRRQTTVIQKEVDEMQKKYRHYIDVVSGQVTKRIIGISAAVVVTAASGGVALAFAPQIAIALAGEAVLGLHGAALTSASLAFVGGGSLAAGGLGMAGGTAIITGGGALVGLASSGTASAAALLGQTSKTYWARQGAKLLTFCNAIQNERMDEDAAIHALEHQLSLTIENLKETLEDLKKEKNQLDDELIKKMTECVDCMQRCMKEFRKFK